MKRMKSLLLGSVAGLAAVAGAQAADLPVAKAAPVDYVRVCSTYGSGFFYIPGTDTCLRISGRVRAEALYLEPNDRADDSLGFRAQGRINIDTRTATAYGLMRAYIRLSTQVRSGTPYGRVGSVDTTGLEQAYIQFGGLTAGRVTSFFSNSDLPTTNWGTLRFYDVPDVNLFAYTFSFGNGFSATLALEDALQTRSTAGTIFFEDDTTVFDPILDYAGQSLPDVVANVKYTGTWGGAQLNAALHQVRPVDADFDTEYGFAIGGSAYANLDALAPGDRLWVVAAYAQGAPAYSGFGGNLIPVTGFRFSGVPDATVDLATGDIDLTESWNIAAGFTHNWTPTISTSIMGSYAQVEFGNSAVLINAAGDAIAGLADFSEWRIGGQVAWKPVSGLYLGLEAIYADAEYDGALAPLAESTLIDRDVGATEVRFRVQRDF